MFKLISIAVITFALGVWGSDNLIGAYRTLFGGEQSISCLPDGGICVGDKLSEKRVGGLYTFDKIGGLSSMFCEDVNPAHIEEELLLVHEIIVGERCEGQIEGFAFRNTTTRTVVRITDGVVTEITRSSLHTIDL